MELCWWLSAFASWPACLSSLDVWVIMELGVYQNVPVAAIRPQVTRQPPRRLIIIIIESAMFVLYMAMRRGSRCMFDQ